MSDALVQHLERHLGRIHGGWTHDETGERLPFSVARFHDTPEAGARTLVTLGLSTTPLLLGGGPKRLRQELLLTCTSAQTLPYLPGLLQHVAAKALRADRAYSARSVLPLQTPSPEGMTTAGLYVAPPVYFPEGLHALASTDGTVLICWLVPITAEEAKLVDTEGWEVFEDLLTEEDPDLLNWARSSMV